MGPRLSATVHVTPSQIEEYLVKPLDEEMHRISQISKISQQIQTQDLRSDSVVAGLLSGQSSTINQSDETGFNDVCEISDGTSESLPVSSTRLEDIRQQSTRLEEKAHQHL